MFEWTRTQYGQWECHMPGVYLLVSWEYKDPWDWSATIGNKWCHSNKEWETKEEAMHNAEQWYMKLAQDIKGETNE